MIDFHTHAFSEKIVAQAVEQLSARSGNIQPVCDGTAQGLLSLIKQHHIRYAVVLNIATKPAQQPIIIEYTKQLMPYTGLIPFASVHPKAADCIDQLEYIASLGIKGVKFHPDYQGFFVDDERVFPLYEACNKLGLITVFHAGVDIGFPEPVHCTPQRLQYALQAFSNGLVVAAHFGGYGMAEEVEKYLVGENLFFDTSFSFAKMPPVIAKRMILNHGTDHILFGSDCPWSHPNNELSFLQSLGLTEQQMHDITAKNAKKLLSLV